ncbi:MAG: YebC/PmpR family DNA-binding transcriptional regulator [Candidatus Peregrinibacteria bacterium]|nr:YebC/PmpR family DNA-binding transcriptional regulator [Candidatus Peregrinibacteria bacterium]
MSGHSKWHSIKHKKGAADAKRGKIFTRHANLITIAARSGGDPDMNPTLRMAIDNAKKENVPNANIDKAIKRGTGEDKSAAQIEEVTYEGYGPAGTAVYVECLTDNTNRTYTNIRTIFNKRGGNLGGSGSVAWMFDRNGVININAEGKDGDEIELAAIDTGARDVEREDDFIEIYTDPSDLSAVMDKLRSAGIEAENAEVKWIPNQTVEISDEKDAQKVLDFMDALDEDPDVSNVSSNFDISDDIMEKITPA